MNNMRKINTHTPGSANFNNQPGNGIGKSVHTADSKQSENASFFARFLASWQKFTTWICNLFSRQVTVTSQSDQLNAANANMKQDSFEKKIQKRIQNIPLVEVNSDSDSPGTILDALARSSKLKGLKQTSNGSSVLKTIQGIHRYLAKKEYDDFREKFGALELAMKKLNPKTKSIKIGAFWKFLNDKLEKTDFNSIQRPVDQIHPDVRKKFAIPEDLYFEAESMIESAINLQQRLSDDSQFTDYDLRFAAKILDVPVLVAHTNSANQAITWYTLYTPSQDEILMDADNNGHLNKSNIKPEYVEIAQNALAFVDFNGKYPTLSEFTAKQNK